MDGKTKPYKIYDVDGIKIGVFGLGIKLEGLVEITKEEVDAILEPTPEEAQAQMISHFKSLYLGVVQDKLDELDYDSLATVKLWEGDAIFGAEATKILTWYKSIITYNYGLLSDVQNGTVPIPDDETYLAGIPAYV
jgi:hypothetical protein